VALALDRLRVSDDPELAPLARLVHHIHGSAVTATAAS
jgi:hypothetical protein